MPFYPAQSRQYNTNSAPKKQKGNTTCCPASSRGLRSSQPALPKQNRNASGPRTASKSGNALPFVLPYPLDVVMIPQSALSVKLSLSPQYIGSSPNFSTTRCGLCLIFLSGNRRQGNIYSQRHIAPVVGLHHLRYMAPLLFPG